ncbi:MAG: hypothetical protein ACRDY0_10245, partial [Acidimicrobiales bacterium]
MARQEDDSPLKVRARMVQRVVGTLGFVAAAAAFGSTFLTFGAFGQIVCGSPISGGKVLQKAPVTSFLNGGEGPVCAGDAHSRMVLAVVIIGVGLVVALGGWLLPTGLPWWMTGQPRPDKEPTWVGLAMVSMFDHLPLLRRLSAPVEDWAPSGPALAFGGRPASPGSGLGAPESRPWEEAPSWESAPSWGELARAASEDGEGGDGPRPDEEDDDEDEEEDDELVAPLPRPALSPRPRPTVTPRPRPVPAAASRPAPATRPRPAT